jgi:antitoxin (DNA-binding transcriptional repressor) of toxin-antitoxin stability system
MLTISTKELRNNFSSVLDVLARGETLLLIHRSHPVAELKKPQGIFSFSEATEKDIEQASLRDMGEDFLSHDELEYYLALQ